MDPALKARGYGKEHVGESCQHSPVADVSRITVAQPDAKTQCQAVLGPASVEGPIAIQKSHADFQRSKSCWYFICHGQTCTPRLRSIETRTRRTNSARMLHRSKVLDARKNPSYMAAQGLALSMSDCCHVGAAVLPKIQALEIATLL